MIKIENVQTWGIEHAVRAARNPLSSWSKSDSGYVATGEYYEYVDYVIGENDLTLMKKLTKAGVPHRTFLRMIQVSMDITAPLYWWKEMDRYTVGKSQVSTSTMHKITAKEFDLDDFSHEHLGGAEGLSFLRHLIAGLNMYREKYIVTKDRFWWWQIIQLLPSSYNQKRTVLMSYEVVYKIIEERTGHKLDEWNVLIEELKKLPYIEELLND